jgi:hypothetical protein
MFQPGEEGGTARMEGDRGYLKSGRGWRGTPKMMNKFKFSEWACL